MGRDRDELSPAIVALHTDIVHWRASKRWRSQPMPDALWQRAMALTQHHSRGKLARHLGLDPEKLRRLVKESAHRAPALAHQASASSSLHFVEVSAADLFTGSVKTESVIEMVRSDGAQVRVRQPGPVDVSALASAFFRAH